MPVNTYEGMFVLDSAKTTAGWDAAEAQVHDILRKHNAEIVASRLWDERRLAYAVRGQKKGTYLLTFFRADASALKEISNDCRLNDLILRELITKVHPKLTELQISQAMTHGPHEDEDGPPPRERDRDRDRDDDDRPRRRRDRDEGRPE